MRRFPSTLLHAMLTLSPRRSGFALPPGFHPIMIIAGRYGRHGPRPPKGQSPLGCGERPEPPCFPQGLCRPGPVRARHGKAATLPHNPQENKGETAQAALSSGFPRTEDVAELHSRAWPRKTRRVAFRRLFRCLACSARAFLRGSGGVVSWAPLCRGVSTIGRTNTRTAAIALFQASR